MSRVLGALLLVSWVLAAPGLHAQAKKAKASSCAEQDARIVLLEQENGSLRARLGDGVDAGVAPEPAEAGPSTSPAGGDGFGGLPWGASTKQLKKKVPKAKPNADGSTWMVPQQLAGRDAMVGYIFVEDQFVVALVFFTASYMNKNRYLDDHEEVRELLTKKYGPPSTSSRDYWSDDLYRDDPNNWGMAVSTGRLTRISAWDTPTTEIELVTKGENFDITNRIRYGSKKYAKLFEEYADKKKTDGL